MFAKMFVNFLLLKNLFFIGFLGNFIVESKIAVYSDKGTLIEKFSEKEFSGFSVPVFFSLYKKGVIDLGDPVDGCSPVRNTSALDQSLIHFVLIDANGCFYETKVLNAQDRGYSAVLIAKSDTSTPVKMDKLVSAIPVVFIKEVDYKKIADNYVYSVNQKFRVRVVVSEEEICGVVIFAVIVIMIIMVVVFIAGIKVTRSLPAYLRRRRVSKYKRGNSVEICSICQRDLEDGTIGSECSPCLHMFHIQCIQQWMDSSDNESRPRPLCPNCMQEITGCRELTVRVVPTETTPLLRNIAINA